jgi:F0F1-type ATP synthase assembly protein I
VTHKGVRHEQPSAESPKQLHQRALANGFGVAMGTATELALLPAVFGALGWYLDGRLGTEPVFLVALLVFAFAGMLVRAWLGYDKEMREQEAGLYTRLGRRGPKEGPV